MNLDKLHELLALALPKALLARISDGTATAADLNVARQYLKDNGVQSTPSANPHMAELTLKLGDVVLDDEDVA